MDQKEVKFIEEMYKIQKENEQLYLSQIKIDQITNRIIFLEQSKENKRGLFNNSKSRNKLFFLFALNLEIQVIH